MFETVGEMSRSVQQPLYVTTKVARIRRASKILLSRFEREPFIDETAKFMRVSEKKVRNILDRRYELEHLDGPIGPAKNGSGTLKDTHLSIVGQTDLDPLEIFERKEALIELIRQFKSFISSLEDLKFIGRRDKMIFRMYYGLNSHFKSSTMQKIGDRYGVKRQRIEQVLSKVWSHLVKKGFNRNFGDTLLDYKEEWREVITRFKELAA